MKILVLDEEFPYPLNAGKRTRSFHLYRRLASRCRIRYIGYGEENSAAAALKAANIETVAVPARVPPKQGIAFYLRLFANLFSPLPYIVSSHYSSLYQQAVEANLAEFRPDLVLCEWTPYAIYVKGLTTVRKLLSTHNIEADIWRRYYETETNPLRREYIRVQGRKVEQFERAALVWVDGALAVSSADYDRLIQWRSDLPVRVIPNGVDLEYFHSLPQPKCRQHVVFTGSMDWRPNQDAARYFVQKILPLLRQSRPELECTFAGRDPPADIRALTTVPGVHITGTVEDVRPYVERAAVYIVPLRIGGGSRLKILEALAMGRAVVSTPVGAEGLDVSHDRHLRLAATPMAFAQSVLRLLDDPAKCRELGAAGRSLVEQHYGWDALADSLEEFVHELVGSQSPRYQAAPAAKRIA